MKSLKYHILVLLISALPFIIIFTTSLLLHTSDGGVHLPRMGAYYKALVDGHIPVRWAGDLNYGYGLPLFNFMYPLPYLVSSFFIALHTSLVTTFKLDLSISFILSGLFMYVFAKEWLKDEKKALLLTIFYQFAPFRLVEILTRGAIGGIYAYSFFPLVLYGLTLLSKKPTLNRIILVSIATGLMVISHNSLSLIFFGVCIVYSFIFLKKTTFVRCFIGLSGGLGLAAFYWIPALAEHKYTYGDLFMKDLYKQNFPLFVNFFIPNFTNDVRLRISEISVQFGLFHVLAIVLSLYGLIKKQFDKKTKIIIYFGLALTAVTLFIMQPISMPLWAKISMLRQFQFPWRFLAVTCFSTALLSVAWFHYVQKHTAIFWMLILLVVGSTGYYWYPTQGFDKPVSESTFWNYPLNTTYFGETDVIWSAGPAHRYPTSRVSVIEGKGQISLFTKKTQIHTFTLNAETPVRLVDRTQYFPGWRVYVDNQKVPIQFQDQNWRGLITFSAPAGVHKVRVVFEESPVRSAADIITIISAFIIVCTAVVGFVRKRK